MPQTFEMLTNRHLAVGPYTDLYHHGPVVALYESDEMGDDDAAHTVFACLDCGFVTHDSRMMMHEDCERGLNPTNKTFRELIEDDGFPDGPGGAGIE